MVGTEKNGLACLLKHEAAQIERYYEFIEKYEDNVMVVSSAKEFLSGQIERIDALNKLIAVDVKKEGTSNDED